MPFRRSVFTIVRILTRGGIRVTGLNGHLTRILVNNTFNFISVIYERFGFITTIQSIYTLFSFIYNRQALDSNILGNRLLDTHPELKTLFLQYIMPNWSVLLGNRNRFLWY